ncbi:bifunctional metallophosphatase/5'-nucleotidase [Ectobacillus panaciterrae]|uniref:bifunctional metallophosphatase/5'-nucleotidase n=1 Tax=Ectobacillus panaciterrae TaxID=363872 RepID=UPI0004035413|nr:bifunctional UDP-sugar hydrolase/5'-nucleotidase [Ectobacillus panaciterrae]
MNKHINVAILQTSDIHGAIYPLHYGDNTAAEAGIAKISTLIKQERAKSNNVIVIDNGDLIQGTPLTYHYAKYMRQEKNPLSLILNHIGYDGAVLGNHEFNYGMNVLHTAVTESQIPYLSANILHKSTMNPYFGTPYIIQTIEAGVRIAILGVTTHYIPNWENPDHIEELVFEDALSSTKKWVQYIREHENPDVLIVSYHGGFERDLETGEPTEILTGENQGYAMCFEVEGIDILLTGHQHRSIVNQKVNGVTVLQPGSNGRSLGKVHIALMYDDNQWLIQDCYSELLSVEGIEADEAVLALAAVYEDKTQHWLDQPIGTIEGNMLVEDPMQIRIQDNALIEFINKVQMHTAGVDISNTALFDNASPGFKHNITMRDIVSNYIYPNTLKVIRITGQDIKDALEQSAQYFMLDNNGAITVNPSFTEPKPQHYNYDMWEGIVYTLNISKPIGERVVSLQYEGQPIHLEQEFDVVMNNYRAGGGGNYMMYQNKPVIKDIPMDMSELITSYILERGTIQATVNHNWKVITD